MQVGELFHCADAYVTVVTVKPQRVGDGATSGGGVTPGTHEHSAASPPQTRQVGTDAHFPLSPVATAGMTRVTPVQLPFQLVPQTPAELMRHKVRDKGIQACASRRQIRFHELPAASAVPWREAEAPSKSVMGIRGSVRVSQHAPSDLLPPMYRVP